MELQIAADRACHCGENPLWHPQEDALYWIDVDTSEMFRLDIPSGGHQCVYQGETIGGMTLHEDGRLLLFLSGGAIRLWGRDRPLETLIEGLPGERDSRFNDVVADPRGRVFAGTMPSANRPGRLYRLDPDGTVTTVLDEAGQPNGMAFSPDLNFFYLTDTQARTISRFRYQISDGSLSEREVLVKPDDGNGNPDGLAVDSEGYLWSARWGGNCLLRYNPQGKEVEKIEFPVDNVTSLCFSGKRLSSVFVTTAGGADRPGAGQNAGALFRLELSLKGLPSFLSRRE